jgi:cell division protein FtsI (penicillin-binding protein 3)
VQKVFTFAAVADQGKVTPRTRLVVPGKMEIDGFDINDDWEHGRIRLTATGAIAKSSNLATIRASRRISEEQLGAYLRAFGSGEPTGPRLAGGVARHPGRPGGLDRRPGGDRGLRPGVSVTALQMAAGVSAIANGGQYIAPTLVSDTPSPTVRSRGRRPLTRRVISAARRAR